MSVTKAHIVYSGKARGPRNVRFDIFGDQISVKLGHADTDGSYAIMEGVTPPQGGPPLHRHSRENESFYIMEGDFVFEIDGEKLPAGPGCTLFAPRGTAHTFQNVGKTPGRLLVIVQPAGLDVFFDEVAQIASGMAQPDLKVIVPLFQKYGLELLGPPMAAKAAAAGGPNA
jgi:mannose-6-phosphate isomerase-like protein (cupin superfamily)